MANQWEPAGGWVYNAEGLNQSGLTREQQADWDARQAQMMSQQGYSWQPTYSPGTGGFHNPADRTNYINTAAPPPSANVTPAPGAPVVGGTMPQQDPAARDARVAAMQAARAAQPTYGAAAQGVQQSPFGGYGTSSGASNGYGQNGMTMPSMTLPGTGGYGPEDDGMAYAGGSKWFDESGGGYTGGPNYKPPAQRVQQSPLGGYGTGSGSGGSYMPPAAGSATATNPFLNLGLNAFTNTQQAWNPGYLNPLVSSLWNQAGQQWNDVINPSINNSAILAGGYGGDRAAISKGVAADRLNQSVFNAVAPVYAQGYENWANRALQGGQAAAGVGSGLEQLDLSRMLGIGGLQNAGRALDISQQNANTGTAAQAANSAGVPTYTNPLSAGLGGALGIAQLLNLIYGNS